MRKNACLALLLGFGATLAVSAAADDAVAPGVSSTNAAAPPPRRAARPAHWAYRPVRDVEVPTVAHSDWVRSPIDAFVLRDIEALGLTPSPDADRATYIRRATLDVLGYIPTPEEVAAFVADDSPDAYEKLVDRLLASEQYGVRQARRWLDLARYADSTGFEGDQTREAMFRYRDYVVDSFNANKPFDRFVLEQIAGDEIATDDQQALIATGFMAGYPDNRNSRDMVQRKYQIQTDITDMVGEVFLATTVQCARCHDHKFDPISQKEYFQLHSFFANVIEVNTIPVQKTGPLEEEYRAAQAKWQEATAELRAEQRAIFEPLRNEAIQYQKERYLTDTRDSLFKPWEEWNALDRWINYRWENVTRGSATFGLEGHLESVAQKTLEETGKEDKEALATLAELERIDKALGKFNNLRPRVGTDKIAAMTELGSPEAPPSFVFFGGDHERPLDEVQPDFPAALAAGAKPNIVPSDRSSGRRTALAEWLTSPENPLTARVYVNRVWAQYFGTGIVKTVSNFGANGTQPTHPELLDYLAKRFVDSGWSVKALHRDILLSSVYRQSSESRDDVFEEDPENEVLATFPRRRLDAEQLRDSLLAASGTLDLSLGGPSVFPPVPGNLNAGSRWQVSNNKEDHNRRSLYIFTRRSSAYPMLDVFDMASPQQPHSERQVTTTALQALTLYNSDVVFEWSKALAGRVIRDAGGDGAAQIDRLYEILFARKPDEVERSTLLSFLDEHVAVLKEQSLSDGKFAVNVPTGIAPAQAGDPLRASALVDLVHTVANSNEFAYRL